MSTQSINFPVLSLNKNITKFLTYIAEPDIRKSIESGLHNEIRLIDLRQAVTIPAGIAPVDFSDNECSVTLSAAFCQFVWFICDIILKLTDKQILQEGANSKDISLNRFIKSSLKELKQVKIMPKIRNYYESIENFGRPMFNSQILEEASLCDKLVSGSAHLAMRPFQRFPPKSKYEERVNSVYCFAISLVLLHEHGHYDLGHLANIQPSMTEENEADQSAFWSIYLHDAGDKKFSMICGILLGFFSILMLNPNLEPDNIHPQEDQRLSEFYDLVRNDNPKYTILYNTMIGIWKEYREQKNRGYGLKEVIFNIIKR